MRCRLPLALLLVTTTAFASDPRQDAQLHVVSYNIKGLPNLFLSSAYQPERYALIGQHLAQRNARKDGPAIVLLQEAFSDRTRALIREAGYPYVSEGPPSTSLLGVSSGLFILSRYPIIAESRREFGDRACSGWDCLAHKGMQYARIAVPGIPQPIDVFNTHMQAGRGDVPARDEQVRMLLDFYRAHRVPGHPVVLGGDLNIRPLRNSASYQELILGSGLSNSGEFCLQNNCARSPDTGWQGVWENSVDHQFYASGERVQLTPLSVERTYREPLDGYKLSDHLAYEVRFSLRTKTGSIGHRFLTDRDPRTFLQRSRGSWSHLVP